MRRIGPARFGAGQMVVVGGLLGLGACATGPSMMMQRDVAVCRPGLPCQMQPIGAVTARLDDTGASTAAEVPESARGLLAAAERGVPDAQYRLATLLFRGGDGFRRQSYPALQWMRRGAEGGDVRAQRAVGRLYMTGLEEMGQDPREGRQWLSMAAAGGDRQARADLAEMDRAEREERDFLRALALKQAETRRLWLVVLPVAMY